MIIDYIKGNLLDTEHKFIAHGVNCQGVMNSGVARAIRQKWPLVYTEFLKDFDYRNNRLGTYSAVQVDNKVIFNIYTQVYYGYEEDKKYASYDAIDNGFKQLYDNHFCEDLNRGYSLAIPKIGCGFGGLEWCICEKIIDFRTKEFPVHVYVLEE